MLDANAQLLITLGAMVQTKFQFYEIVRVIADSPLIRQSLLQKEGIIVGRNEADTLNKRDYAVHFNEYGETFVLPEDLLESCGRVGSREDVVSRGSQIGCRRSSWPPPLDPRHEVQGS